MTSTSSRSFDRAAHIYDQTRPLLEPIAQHGIPALLDFLRPGTRVLEAGAGTGRISIPLLERGVDLFGCDLSSRMLARFREKYAQARLARTDVSRLPFPAGSFGAVLTVHVMHLVAPWREALSEFRRVLVPGGVYLNVRTWSPVGNNASEDIRIFWRGWLASQGVNSGPVGVRDPNDFRQALLALGATFREVEVVRYPDPYNLREELDRFASRSFSETWDIPETIFQASLEELRAWAAKEYGSLDREITDQVCFLIQVAQF